MCAVSVMYDYMRTAVPLHQWTRPIFNEFQEIIQKLDRLDKQLDQPDCEDPSKVAR